MRLAVTMLLVSTWLCTPIGTLAVDTVVKYFNYDVTTIHNGDQMPLLPQHFALKVTSISNYLLFAYLVFAAANYGSRFVSMTPALPKVYRSWRFVLVVGIGLFLLMTRKYRTGRYLDIFLVPIASIALDNVLVRLKNPSARRMALIGASLVGAVLPHFVTSGTVTLGVPVYRNRRCRSAPSRTSMSIRRPVGSSAAIILAAT